MFTRKSIDSIYTQYVCDLLNKGFVINTKSMSGMSSEEVCHIDLIDPNDSTTVNRVWITKHYAVVGDNRFDRVNTLNIVHKTYTNKNSSYFSVSDGNVVSNKTFYAISDNNTVFTDNFDEVKSIFKLQQDRWLCKYISSSSRKYLPTDKVSSVFKHSIMKRINAIHGAKKATYDCVDKIELYKYDNRLMGSIEWHFGNKSGKINLH